MPLTMAKDKADVHTEDKKGVKKNHLVSDRSNVDHEEDAAFGPWMIVQKDARKCRGGAHNIGKVDPVTRVATEKKGGVTPTNGSRFQILNDAAVTDHVVKENNLSDMDNSHEDTPALRTSHKLSMQIRCLNMWDVRI